MPVRVLDWSTFGSNGVDIADGTTVDTGGVAVTFGFTELDEGAAARNFEFEQNVDDLDGVDGSSGLKLFGAGGEGGIDPTSTTTLTFASTGSEFGDAVQDVSFRINDIDLGQAGSDYTDIVTIRAYDTDGNEIPVTLTPGGDVVVTGNTATGNDVDATGATPPTAANTSLLVQIAGPVARIEIDYANGGSDDQAVWVTDIVFSTTDPVGDVLTATDDVIETDEDTAASIVATANDVDPQGDPLEIISVDTTGVAGEVTVGPDGQTITYDPNGQFESLGTGETATETFTYTVTDGNGNTDTATVTVTINGVNDAPDAADDTGATGTPGGSVTIPVLANDTDPESDPLSIVAISTPANGTVVDNGDGTVTYTPTDPTFVGEDTFTYTVTDPEGATDTATVTVFVGDPDSVFATDDVIETDEDTAASIVATANDATTGTGPLEITSVDTAGVLGTVTIDPDGQTLTYDPSGQFESLQDGETATETFTYEVTDADGNTATATVTVTIAGVNDDPDAVDDNSSGIGTQTIAVLANDTDPEGDPLTVINVTSGTNGTTTINADGTITYTPDTGFTGIDTFTYEIEDGNGGTDTATVTVEVLPCFTPGTVIATPRGERRVEDLQVGDRVITRDNGLQQIRWIGKRTLSRQELQSNPQLLPVLIQAGALGHGLPERDLLVSPQHRILMNSDRAALYFEEREVLAAAKHLTDLEGVDVVDASSITYIHIMFDHHEVVLSNGSWTESFQPGEQVLDGMGTEQQNEIYALFPELREKEGLEAYQSARRALKKHEAKLLVK